MISEIRRYLLKEKKRVFQCTAVIGVLIAAFFAGRYASAIKHGHFSEEAKQAGVGAKQIGIEAEQNRAGTKQVGAGTEQVRSAADAGVSGAELTVDSAVMNAAEGSWGLSFQEEGKPPVANATREELAQYGAWYAQDTQEKIIYLTFDCGYENGNTPAILSALKNVANATREELAQYGAWYAQDTQEKIIYLTFDCGYENGNTPAILSALKKHNAPATFFVVGNFVEDNPELVKQMLLEGHTVGNHTMHHPDMSKIAQISAFEKEIGDLEHIFEEATGQEISRYYRPPQGKYSEANLKMAQQLGYQTFFWSLAYVDWYEDQQPTKEEAFEKLLGRIHPGAIVLLHNTSATNGAILDELLTKWEEMGYKFGCLKDLTEAEK